MNEKANTLRVELAGVYFKIEYILFAGAEI